MFWTVSVLATLLAAVSAEQAGRTFAVLHTYGNGPLMYGRVDPIVDPGVTGGHVHMVMGGSGFGLTMTAQQALDSQCTTALIINDKSNYWVPSLYFQDPGTGQLESVPLFYFNVYYLYVSRSGLLCVVGLTALQLRADGRRNRGFPTRPPGSGGECNATLAAVHRRRNEHRSRRWSHPAYSMDLSAPEHRHALVSCGLVR